MSQKRRFGGIRTIGLIMSMIMIIVTSATTLNDMYVMNMTTTATWCQ
jgi:hypothetical protein